MSAMTDFAGYGPIFVEGVIARSISQNSESTPWTDIRPKLQASERDHGGVGKSACVDASSDIDLFPAADDALTASARSPTYGHGGCAPGVIHLALISLNAS
jgi:hypothetical protein